MRKRVDVAIGVLIENGPQGLCVLIARRPNEVALGGFWELPGGKLEPAEAAPDCLRREFLEELGLRIRVERALTIIEHDYNHARVRLHPYVCRRVAGAPRDLAVAEHRWVRPDQLADYPFPPANVSLIAEIMEVLRELERQGQASNLATQTPSEAGDHGDEARAE